MVHFYFSLCVSSLLLFPLSVSARADVCIQGTAKGEPVLDFAHRITVAFSFDAALHDVLMHHYDYCY